MIETLMLSLKIVAFLCLDVLAVAITGILALIFFCLARLVLREFSDED